MGTTIARYIVAGVKLGEAEGRFRGWGGVGGGVAGLCFGLWWVWNVLWLKCLLPTEVRLFHGSTMGAGTTTGRHVVAGVKLAKREKKCLDWGNGVFLFKCEMVVGAGAIWCGMGGVGWFGVVA